MRRNKYYFIKYFAARAVVSFLALTCLLSTSACSTEQSNSDPEHTPTEDDFFVDIEDVKRQARTQTLRRMIEEGDPGEVIEKTGEEPSEILINTGVINIEESEYYIETDRTKWNITADLSQKTSISAVDSSLAFAMRRNNVNWCEGSLSGSEFVRIYMDDHEDSFSSYEEYEKSISDYVDCGTGEL